MKQRYQAVRAATRRLCEPLSTEDFVVQSMPDVSPTKWHLAHTTWFFETFLLRERGEEPYDPDFGYLFNSYYNAVGEQYPRARRGLMTRPTVDEIWRYRQHVNDRVERMVDGGLSAREAAVLEVGLNHEQQHQELMLTDIKHVLAQSPSAPSYGARPAEPGPEAPLSFTHFDGGVVTQGFDGEGFCFDNELPKHEVLVQPFLLASRLVTTAEYEAFIADGGYTRSELWLSEGWDWLKRERVAAPLYWRGDQIFTLSGERPRLPSEPVTHVSLYEADAYARWAGGRLPREAELECAARAAVGAASSAGRPGAPLAGSLSAEASEGAVQGNFVESGRLHPKRAASGEHQVLGDAWEWTQSAYGAYPGYRPADGALGEYNGKFMCNQHVLRGGSCATSRDHMRVSYRNFFPAHTRWQFTGIRVARDAT